MFMLHFSACKFNLLQSITFHEIIYCSLAVLWELKKSFSSPQNNIPVFIFVNFTLQLINSFEEFVHFREKNFLPSYNTTLSLLQMDMKALTTA